MEPKIEKAPNKYEVRSHPGCDWDGIESESTLGAARKWLETVDKKEGLTLSLKHSCIQITVKDGVNEVHFKALARLLPKYDLWHYDPTKEKKDEVQSQE